MNKIIICILFLISFSLKSQIKDANNWVEYGVSSVKICVIKDGIYKISAKELSDAGLSLSNLNIDNLKLYYLGKEIPIYLFGDFTNDQSNSYLEFYGERYKGQFDSLLYRPINGRPHQYSSLISDKSTYFLFLSKTKSTKRISKTTYKESKLAPENFYLKSGLKIFEDEWSFDPNRVRRTLYDSYYIKNEGLCSESYGLGFFDRPVFKDSLLFTNIYKGQGSKYLFDLKILCNGDNVTRNLEFNFNNKKSNQTIFGTQSTNFKVLDSLDFVEKNQFSLKILNSTSTDLVREKIYDPFSVFYFNYKYTSKFVYDENEVFELIPNKFNNSYIELKEAPNLDFEIFSINNQDISKIDYKWENNIMKFSIKNSEIGVKFILQKVQLKPINIEKKIFIKSNEIENQYIIVTNKILIESAKKYGKYRASAIGGNFNICLKEIEDLNDEFNYGLSGSIGIKNYLLNIKNSKSNGKFVLLIGKGFARTNEIKKKEKDILVPTLGYPGSDFALSAFSDSTNLSEFSSVPIGRISATNNEQVENYLKKIIEFETDKNSNNWKKRFLHLSGGKTEFEISNFSDFLKKLSNNTNKLGAEVTLFSKKTTSPVENLDISNETNKGVSLITFLGHASTSTIDLDIGFASDIKSKFENKPFYPFMFFNGCQVNNIFNFETNTFSEDWLLTPNKGAIGILAHSSNSYVDVNKSYMDKFYKTLFSSPKSIDSYIGDIIMETNNYFVKNESQNQFIISNIRQLLLQGDPAIRIFSFNKPDLQTEDGKLFLTSLQKNKSITDGDSLKIGIIISNYGIYEAGTKVNLNLKKEYLDGKIVDYPISIKAVAYQDTAYVSMKKELNLKYIIVTVDNDKKIDEIDETNNMAAINFNWEALKNTNYYSSAVAVDVVNPNLEVKLEGRLPKNGMEASQSSVLEISLTDENSFGNKTDKLEINYRKICKTCPETLTKLELGTIFGEPNEVLTNISLKNFLPGQYQFYIQGFDAKKNASGEVFSFTFKMVESDETITLKVFPNPITLYTTFEIGVSELNSSLGLVNYNLDIFSQKGVLIKTFIGYLQSSQTSLYWDTKDSFGNDSEPGLYIYKLMLNKNGNTERKVGKISLLK